MPEIAEVRTVASTLNKQIVGRTIKSIEYRYSDIILGDKELFKKTLEGLSFCNITNCGKWLIFNLGEYSFISHLRMEGKYFIKPSSDLYDKHEHIIFHLDDNTDLRYHDVRKFGKMKLIKSSDVYSCEEISKLGIEPDSNKLTKEYLYEKIRKSNKPIKELLLDQSIVNGLGNIYVDEVLFASGIMQTRLGKDVSIDECDLIRKNACSIIKAATKAGGTTIRSYTSSLGVEGTYQTNLRVHTKEGEKCPRCGSIILKTRVGGRGTYYCPKCQK